MPNWCSTTYTFTGSRDDIISLYNKIDALKDIPKEPNRLTYWLGNLLKAHGYDLDELEKQYPAIRYRGTIIDYFYDKDVDKDFDPDSDTDAERCLDVVVDTAWSPCHLVWKLILDKYPSIDQSKGVEYYSEETGMGLFPTSDIRYKYILDFYNTDTDFEGTHACLSEDDALHLLSTFAYQYNGNFKKSIDEASDFIDQYNDENKDGYRFITLYEYDHISFIEAVNLEI